MNRMLFLNRGRVFKLFKLAIEEATRNGRKAPGQETRKPYYDASSVEVKSILDKYSASEKDIGKKSTFGKVYSGTKDGNPVAIKIELRDTDSHEYDNLQALKYLRSSAPDSVKKHLPIIYEVAGGKYYTWYVMEMLQPLPADIKEELAGIEYEINEEDIYLRRGKDETDEEYKKRLEEHKDALHDALHYGPEEINQSSNAITVNLNDARFSDIKLIESAFSKWYTENKQRKDVFNAVMAELDPDDYNSQMSSGFKKEKIFEDKIRKYITEAISAPGKQGKATIQTFAKQIADAVAGKLSGKVELESWEEIKGNLPELIFGIVRTNWLPKFDPSAGTGGRYETLGRTMEHLDEGDYRRSLRAALSWLSEHGLKWGDVHSSNVMLRPSTGDIVFIDYGLYRFMQTK